MASRQAKRYAPHVSILSSTPCSYQVRGQQETVTTLNVCGLTAAREAATQRCGAAVAHAAASGSRGWLETLAAQGRLAGAQLSVRALARRANVDHLSGLSDE